MTDYAEFRLRIEPTPAPNTYRVESSGPGGEMAATFELPFNDTELENIILKLGRTRRGIRKIESSETEIARAFGGRLFKTIMAGGIGETYRAAHGEARLRAEGLRVTLSLTDAPKLATIPWEFLFDDPDFLATSPETPIVRFLDVAKPHRPLEISLPIRILVVICSPANAEQLNTGLERANLEPALKPLSDLNAVKIDWLEHATLSALNTKLRSESYHILHFIGHGGFDEAHGEGALLFEDDSGQGAIVGADRLAGLLRSRDSIRLVVLNSCEGARSSIDDPFSGVAASLIERGFPAVIGMQFEISDRAAILFAREFYTVLAEGDPVDKAVAEARLAMFAGQDDVEWGTPVLYMRVANGRLFEIANAVPIERDKDKPPAGSDPPGGTGGTGGAGDGPTGATRGGPVPVPVPVGPGPVAQPVPQPKPAPPWRRFLTGLSGWQRILLGAAVAAPIAVVALIIALSGPQPTVRGRPISDRPGYLHVTGEGFQANEDVDLTLGEIQKSVPANATGAIEEDIEVGVGKSGSITAIGHSSSRRAESSYSLPGSSQIVSIEPSVSVEPTSPSVTPSSAPPSITTGSCLDVGIRENSIVFYSDRDVEGNALGEYHVFCIDPDTGSITSVLPDEDLDTTIQDSFAAWSPDHTQIAFTRRMPSEGPSEFQSDILIRNEDGSVTPLMTSQDDDSFPAWSTDGWIAFVRNFGSEHSIMRMRVGDQEAQPMTTERNLLAPAWSRDGSTVAFMGYNEATEFDLGTVSVSTPGAAPTWLTLTKDDRVVDNNDMNPAWSPIENDPTMVFVTDKGSNDGPDNDIWLMNVETQQVGEQLTGLDVRRGLGVQDGNPVWSPDGTRIAFYRATKTGFHIWVMNRDGTDQQDLMPGRPGRNLDPVWK